MEQQNRSFIVPNKPKQPAETFQEAENNVPIRVDEFIIKNIGEKLTRSQLKKALISITINGKSVKLARKVRPGDKIELKYNVKPTEQIIPQAEDIPLNIIYEDNDILVINKDANMTIHPALGTDSGTLVNALLYRYDNLPGEDKLRPGIVHRLDKETSGLMVIAKSEVAFINLKEAFKNRQIIKEYEAIIKGRMNIAEGLITQPIGRDPHNRKRMAVREDGKYAKTGYKVIKEYEKYSLLKLTLFTGRTHQIRVHLKFINKPILGDSKYSRVDKLTKQLCLVATNLQFSHPVTNEKLTFSIPRPAFMTNILDDF